MTAASTAPAAAGDPRAYLPNWADGMGSAFLMGAGQVLLKHNFVDAAGLQIGVGDVMSLAGLVWHGITLDPSKVSPIAALLSVIRAAPQPSRAAYNAGVIDLEALAEKVAAKIIAAQAGKIPVLGGIVARAGDEAADKVVAQEGALLEVPQ